MSAVQAPALQRSYAPGRNGRRLVAVLSAPLIAASMWAIEVKGFGAHLSVRFPHGATEIVGVGQIVGASLVAALAGWLLLVMLEKRTANPRSRWTALAILAVVASLALPVAAATTVPATFALIGIHASVGHGVIAQLRASATSREARSA